MSESPSTDIGNENGNGNDRRPARALPRVVLVPMSVLGASLKTHDS